MICTAHPIFFGVIKPRKMRWAGHVARIGEKRGVYRVLMGKPVGNSQLEDPGVEGRIILRGIFRTWDVWVWTGSSWLRIGAVGGHL